MAALDESTLRRLAELRPGVPVLSAYLDLDPSQFSTIPSRKSALRSMIDAAHKEVEAYDADHAGKASLRADVKRLEEELSPEGIAEGGARGLAIFAASAADLFERLVLPRPTSLRVVIDDRPHLWPVLLSADQREWLIAIADRVQARVFGGTSTHLVEEERLVDEDLLVEHDRGPVGEPWRERHVENDAERHLKHAATEVARRLRERPGARLLTGGPDELAARLESHLPKDVRARLCGRIDVDLHRLSPAAVLAAAAPVFERDERERERAALDLLAERVGMELRVAVGLPDVREALVERRVETLLYAPSWAEEHRHEAEEAVEQAVLQSAEVLPVRHHDLDGLGPIAALLRF